MARTTWMKHEKTARAALRKDPDDVEAAHALATALLNLAKYRELVRCCEAALPRAKDKTGFVAYLVTGQMMTRPEDVVATYRRYAKRLDRTHADYAMLLQNAAAGYGKVGRAAEGIRDLGAAIDACKDEGPVFNAACLAALAKDKVRLRRWVWRERTRSGRPASGFDDADFDGVRAWPEFVALLARDPTGVADVLAALRSDELARVRTGVKALRAAIAKAGFEATPAQFGFTPPDGRRLMANAMLDGLLARFGKRLGTRALLDLIAAIFGEATQLHDQRALATALALLRPGTDAKIDREIAAIFARAVRSTDDGHRAHEHTALDHFLDKILPQLTPSVLTSLLAELFAANAFRDVEVLLPRAFARDRDARRLGTLMTRVESAWAPIDPYDSERLELLDACLKVRGLPAPIRARLTALRGG